jgi:DegV family protein with EDD domain
VVTDSTSSLPAAVASGAGVVAIPLNVIINGQSRPETDVDPGLVAAALRAEKPVTTSRPSPQAIASTYEGLAAKGYEAVVSVHLSSKISGTFEAAQAAARGAPLPVIVVDSGSIGMVTGFAAISGAACAQAGGDPEEVAATVRARAQVSTIYFCVDNLEYLRRSGRINPGAALIGSVLSVKPLLTIVDGEIRSLDRVRTASRALARLEALSLAALEQAAGRGAQVDVALHHLDGRGAAEQLAASLISARTGGDVMVCEISAVLGAHVGPGTVGVVIAPRS